MVKLDNGGKGEISEIIKILTERNNNIIESLAEIRGQLPYLATKEDLIDGIQRVMDRHVELYHINKRNTPKSIERPSIVSDNAKKIIGALITVISILGAVIYFLIGK